MERDTSLAVASHDLEANPDVCCLICEEANPALTRPQDCMHLICDSCVEDLILRDPEDDDISYPCPFCPQQENSINSLSIYSNPENGEKEDILSAPLNQSLKDNEHITVNNTYQYNQSKVSDLTPPNINSYKSQGSMIEVLSSDIMRMSNSKLEATQCWVPHSVPRQSKGDYLCYTDPEAFINSACPSEERPARSVDPIPEEESPPDGAYMRQNNATLDCNGSSVKHQYTTIHENCDYGDRDDLKNIDETCTSAPPDCDQYFSQLQYPGQVSVRASWGLLLQAGGPWMPHQTHCSRTLDDIPEEDVSSIMHKEMPSYSRTGFHFEYSHKDTIPISTADVINMNGSKHSSVADTLDLSHPHNDALNRTAACRHTNHQESCRATVTSSSSGIGSPREDTFINPHKEASTLDQCSRTTADDGFCSSHPQDRDSHDGPSRGDSTPAHLDTTVQVTYSVSPEDQMCYTADGNFISDINTTSPLVMQRTSGQTSSSLCPDDDLARPGDHMEHNNANLATVHSRITNDTVLCEHKNTTSVPSQLPCTVGRYPAAPGHLLGQGDAAEPSAWPDPSWRSLEVSMVRLQGICIDAKQHWGH